MQVQDIFEKDGDQLALDDPKAFYGDFQILNPTDAQVTTTTTTTATTTTTTTTGGGKRQVKRSYLEFIKLSWVFLEGVEHAYFLAAA